MVLVAAWTCLLFGLGSLSLLIGASNRKDWPRWGTAGVVLLVLSWTFFSAAGSLRRTLPGAATHSRIEVKVAQSYAPIARPTSRPAGKREFIRRVDESITGTAIAGNPYRYVGKKVDLHCTVDSIPERSYFNATCGEDADGVPAVVVIRPRSVRTLSKGQGVRVLGTVATPMDGINGAGLPAHFPTVDVEFIE